MKRIIVLLAISFFAHQVSAQNTTYFTGSSAIDGLSADWSEEILLVDEKTKFTTAIRNDSENLYILFQTADRLAINKLLQAGMEITFKAKTKPKLNAKLEFPLETVRAQGGNRGQGQRAAQGQRNSGEAVDREKLFKERMERQLQSKNQAKLKGFSASNGHLLLTDLDGVEMALGMDETTEAPTFGYEIKIALKTLYGMAPNWDKVYSTDLAINITVNGIERPQGAGGGGTSLRGGGGGRGGAGGGRGGGGRGGAGGRRPNANQAQSNSGVDMFSDQTIKLKYTLSKEN